MAHHTEINRDHWDRNAGNWVAAGERLWALDAPVWGYWDLPEAEIGLLPRDMTGQSAIELGCGTGYVSAWMTRLGADVVDIDISPRQLATAQRLAGVHGLEIAFREGNAEAVDAPDGCFDFAISEYGAAIWCDPEVWLREAWRILAPGGKLRFFGHHPLGLVCTDMARDVTEHRLHLPYRDFRMIDWSGDEDDPGGVEFNRPPSDWIALFREIGFEIRGYREIYAPPEAEGARFGVPAQWARAYPAEQPWFLEKPPQC